MKKGKKGKRNDICTSDSQAGGKLLIDFKLLFVLKSLSWMINCDCHLDWIWNQLSKVPLSSYLLEG